MEIPPSQVVVTHGATTCWACRTVIGLLSYELQVGQEFHEIRGIHEIFLEQRLQLLPVRL